MDAEVTGSNDDSPYACGAGTRGRVRARRPPPCRHAPCRHAPRRSAPCRRPERPARPAASPAASPLAALAGAVLTLAAACATDRGAGPAPGADGGTRCLVAEACDDGVACTVDTCAVGGVCEHAPQNALCPMGQSCDATRGCVAGTPCTRTDECDDGIACTADACAVGGRCEHRPLDALCTGEGETCDPSRGCVRTGCARDEDCDDAIACTVDACAVGGRCENTPVHARCPMGQTCGRSGCFELRPCTTGADCQNGNFCDGEELCDPEFGCQPAPSPRNCDDRNPCTVDACDPAADMCVYSCTDAPSGCPMCPSAPPDYNGTFAISPAPRQSCALGMVSYDISSVRFTYVGGILQIAAGPFTLAQPGPTSSTGPTADGRFDASYEVVGGCTERYRLEGMFMGPDRFTATWTATYVSMDGISCLLGGCANQTLTVTGTRVRP